MMTDVGWLCGPIQSLEMEVVIGFLLYSMCDLGVASWRCRVVHEEVHEQAGGEVGGRIPIGGPSVHE